MNRTIGHRSRRGWVVAAVSLLCLLGCSSGPEPVPPVTPETACERADMVVAVVQHGCRQDQWCAERVAGSTCKVYTSEHGTTDYACYVSCSQDSHCGCCTADRAACATVCVTSGPGAGTCAKQCFGDETSCPFYPLMLCRTGIAAGTSACQP
jgi:hypothetical protein